VPASFFFKLLAHDGSEPVVDCCVNCGAEHDLIAFNAETGGVLCKNCRSGHALSPGGLALLRRILGGDLANVLREEDSPAAGEIMTLAQESVEVHLGRRLKAPRATPALQPRDVDR
jgi:DNA repair protein RecO (recombination protein O)